MTKPMAGYLVHLATGQQCPQDDIFLSQKFVGYSHSDRYDYQPAPIYICSIGTCHG